MKARRESRQCIVSVLYQYRISGEWGTLEEIQGSFCRDNEEPLEDDKEFTSLLFETLVARIEEIDALIQSASRHWKLERMSAVDHCVLRLATAELLLGSAPHRVVLNEAVELARLYGSDSSAPFVNGVLDGVWKAILRQA